MKGFRGLIFGIGLILPCLSSAFETSADSYGFKPSSVQTPFFSLSSAVPLGKKSLFTSLYLDYAHHPFAAQNQLGTATQVISSLITFHASVGYGLTDSMTLALGLPVTPYARFTQIGSADTSGKVGVGDVKLLALWAFMPLKNKSGLSFEPFVEIPTGYDSIYLSQGVFTGGGKLIAEFHPSDKIIFALNSGFHWKPEVELGNVKSGPEVSGGAGLAYRLGENWKLFGEGLARTVVNDFFGDTSSIFEGHGGIQGRLSSSLAFVAGGGTGLGSGIGAPLFRIFSGLTYQADLTPKPKPEPVPPPPPPPEPALEPIPPPPPAKPVPSERKFLPIT